jgi:hypothetical protein
MQRHDSYYGFKTENVDKKFEGGLTYCNTFCLKGSYYPYAVYSVANPNREKGHKDYLLLWVSLGIVLVGGIDKDEMEKWRYQNGVECLKCGDVLYSVYCHDFHTCKCGKVAVDGGRDYLKISGNVGEWRQITFDLVENKVKEASVS